MAFHPVYYITLVCPDLDTSKKMIDQYIDHGAGALQIDMPSRQPDYETDFVKQNMKNALELYKGYDVFLDFFRSLRREHSALELHLVVYPDVIEGIGKKKFVSFFKEVGFASLMLVSWDQDYRNSLKEEGIVLMENLDRDLTDESLSRAASLDEHCVVAYGYRNHSQCARKECPTLKQKIDLIREKGVRCKIYAVEGIATKEMMKEVKDAGMDGALVGNVLMRLWEEPASLWQLFNEFQSLAE